MPPAPPRQNATISRSLLGPKRRPLAPRSWPTPPTGSNAQLLGLVALLENIQWWPEASIVARQLVQLQLLFNHAAVQVPFYADRLVGVAGLQPGTLTLDHLRALPLLQREDLQRDLDAITARQVPPHHGQPFDINTTGSTGRPVRVKGDGLTGLFVRAKGRRFHQWHRRNLLGKSMTIWAVKWSEDMRRGKSWAGGVDSGPAVTVNLRLSSERLLDILLEEDPDYLQIPPSALHQMLRLSRQRGVRPARLRDVRTSTEILDDEVRELCRDVWGVSVANNYSCEEFGIIALQCPDTDCLHIQAEDLLVEILDANDMPCPPGEPGRVVVTSLHNYITPLIRYELGDYAVAGGPCACGRGLPTLERVIGRVRNLIVLPGGGHATPVLRTEAILNDLPVHRFQFIQTTLSSLDAHIVLQRPLEGTEEQDLHDYVQRCFPMLETINLRYVTEIDHKPGQKFEPFKSEV